MKEKSFLGTGWNFPPTFKNQTGTIEMVSDENDIFQSLQILLSTELKERIMRSDYGCDLNALLYESITITLLTKIKGISWAMSASICNALGFNRKTKVGELKSQEIKKIEEFVSNPKLPRFVLNRRKDLSSGKDKHLTSADLDLQKEFDIKKLKKIKSYRGIRHVAGLPLRGQRTRSNFRKNRRKGAGIKKKK